jgi:hypothetical protein
VARLDRNVEIAVAEDMHLTLVNEHAFYETSRGVIAGIREEFKQTGRLRKQSQLMELAIRRWCRDHWERNGTLTWKVRGVIYVLSFMENGKSPLWLSKLIEMLIWEYRDDIIGDYDWYSCDPLDPDGEYLLVDVKTTFNDEGVMMKPSWAKFEAKKIKPDTEEDDMPTIKLKRSAVLETGKANLETHKKMIEEVSSEATAKLSEYVPKLAEHLVVGGVAPKPIKLRTMRVQTDEYEEAITLLEHAAGDEIDASTRTRLLLSKPLDVAELTEREVSFEIV